MSPRKNKVAFKSTKGRMKKENNGWVEQKKFKKLNLSM
jgi:hypothetical protein